MLRCKSKAPCDTWKYKKHKVIIHRPNDSLFNSNCPQADCALMQLSDDLSFVSHELRNIRRRKLIKMNGESNEVSGNKKQWLMTDRARRRDERKIPSFEKKIPRNWFLLSKFLLQELETLSKRISFTITLRYQLNSFLFPNQVIYSSPSSICIRNIFYRNFYGDVKIASRLSALINACLKFLWCHCFQAFREMPIKVLIEMWKNSLHLWPLHIASA